MLISIKKCSIVLIVGLLILGLFQTVVAEEPWEKYDFEGRTVKIGHFWKLDRQFEEGPSRERLLEVEGKFNVNIEFVQIKYPEYAEEVASGVLAGDPPADILLTRRPMMESMYVNDLLYPLNDVLDENYWNSLPDVIRRLKETAYSIGDQIVGFTFGSFLQKPNEDLENGLFIVWNKDLFEREGLPNLYELQEQGKWTWEKMREIVIEATRDTTGDGKIDQWGFHPAWPESFGHLVFSLLKSNNANLVELIDGRLEFTLNEPEAIEALNFYSDLKNEEQVIPDGDQDRFELFMNGKLAMILRHLGGARALHQSGMDDDPGWVMFPKGPNADKYSSVINSVVGCLPVVTQEDPRALIEIINALGVLTSDYRDIDNYEDDILNSDFFNLAARDRESLETMRKVFCNLAPLTYWSLLGGVPGGEGDLSGTIGSIFSGEQSAAAAIEAIKKEKQIQLDEMFNQ